MKALQSQIARVGLGALSLAFAGSCARDPDPRPEVDTVLSKPAKQAPEVTPSPTPAEPVAIAKQPNTSKAFSDGRAALKARNFTAAAAAFEIACEQEDQLQACVALAGLLDSGRGVREDPERAKGLLLRACAADLQSACDQLGH